MSRSISSKSIIVTGASSGIGECIAWHIAKNGGIPIMIARSIGKLARQKQTIDQMLGAQSFVYQADLTNQTELENVFKQILSEHKQIDGLINNAGAGVFDYVETMKLADMENMFHLNVFALIQGTALVLPHFLAKQEGHIINIASQAGKIATPKSAIYASTKHAVLGFTNALRLEMKDMGVHVMAVNLGPVRTNFFDAADPNGTYQKSIDRYMLDPDKVARKVVRHLFTNKREINLPRWMDLGSKLYQLFPKFMEFLLRKQFNRK
ncbi:SDR family NAD(P)-dependent oxidoreductase [Virgibacillus oceani]|uniref:Oxidoreductase n=1 Tax=Virgibacillus oceani TaxID=1479511 RepID=A0A917LWV6_9BACI|nr:SDR family oxidoreductase [Virgibacillus oceani]GGG64223.1 oxidoreductase [Virgibacillus oceani]